MGCTNTARNAGASPAGSGSALAWPWSGTGGAESRNVGVDAVRPQVKTRMADTAARILHRAGRPKRLDIHRSRRAPRGAGMTTSAPQQITDGQLDVAEMTDPEHPGLAGPFLLLALNFPLGLKDEVLI